MSMNGTVKLFGNFASRSVAKERHWEYGIVPQWKPGICFWRRVHQEETHGLASRRWVCPRQPFWRRYVLWAHSHHRSLKKFCERSVKPQHFRQKLLVSTAATTTSKWCKRDCKMATKRPKNGGKYQRWSPEKEARKVGKKSGKNTHRNVSNIHRNASKQSKPALNTYNLYTSQLTGQFHRKTLIMLGLRRKSGVKRKLSEHIFVKLGINLAVLACCKDKSTPPPQKKKNSSKIPQKIKTLCVFKDILAIRSPLFIFRHVLLSHLFLSHFRRFGRFSRFL